MESTPNQNLNKTMTITYANSSFISRTLVTTLLHSNPNSNLTIHALDPTPQTHPQQLGRIVHFQTRLDDISGLRSSIKGSSTVFHVDPTLGRRVAGGYGDWYDKYKLVVEGTRNVVTACLECGVERLIYSGSADVAFNGVNEVLNGDEKLPYPDKFSDVLNDLRAQAEMLVLNANGRDGLSTCVLRISNPFGPGDDHLGPFLVAKAKSTWAKFIIGSGKNLCDFTYVENVAHANLCADQVLSSEASLAAGKPFFITNHEPVKFWDFNANILEGLGYRRPKFHLPVKLVLILAKLVDWICGKLHLSKTCDPFLAPVNIHALSCTKTFDSSNAQKKIQYSPAVSLEDGISATVKSFSQSAIGLPYAGQRDYLKLSKAELLLGSGKVADILLWRDEKRTFTYVLGLFLLYHWFFLSGRNFISSVSNFLLLVSVILLVHGYLPSSMLGLSIEKIPMSYFEVSEYAVKQLLRTLTSMWNHSLLILKSVCDEDNWDVFMKVAGSLCFIKLLLAFPPSILTAVGIICLFSFFIIYEQCEEEIEKLLIIASSGLKKSKEFLTAKLSSFVATYVQKSW